MKCSQLHISWPTLLQLHFAQSFQNSSLDFFDEAKTRRNRSTTTASELNPCSVFQHHHPKVLPTPKSIPISLHPREKQKTITATNKETFKKQKFMPGPVLSKDPFLRNSDPGPSALFLGGT